MVVLGRVEEEAAGLGGDVHTCGYGLIVVVTAAAADTCILFVALALVLAWLPAQRGTYQVPTWRNTNRCAAFIL